MTDTCSWCGLRAATRVLFNSPTCDTCGDADRRFRAYQYLQRLKRAAGE